MKIGRDEKKIDCMVYIFILAVAAAACGIAIWTLNLLLNAKEENDIIDINLYAVITGILLTGIAFAGVFLSAIRVREKTICRALVKEVDSANEDANAKSEILSLIGHEIRTPMNLMSGIAALARRSSDDTCRMMEYIDDFDNAAKYMLSLVRDILDIADSSNGRVQIVNEPFSILKLAADVECMCRPVAHKKRQILSINLSVEHDRVVYDVGRIQQILLNLVTNAIKYTPERGLIELFVTEIDSGEGSGVYEFAVRDNGIGIDETDMERIFEPFERVAQHGECAGEEGSGLGLCICRNLLKMMDSEMYVESRLGEGSVFSFRLIMGFEEIIYRDDRIVELDYGRDINGCKILIADDSEMNLGILSDLLSAEGVIVETAVNGQEAVDIFLNSGIGEFDAVLLDVQMPGMDGLTAAKLIRRSGRTDAGMVPLIAMTAFCTEADHIRSLNAGFTCHVDKPIDVEEVCNLLDELVNKNDRDSKAVC